jgi:hypothetical protein
MRSRNMILWEETVGLLLGRKLRRAGGAVCCVMTVGQPMSYRCMWIHIKADST